MVLVSLSEGDHTIEWSLAGYDTLTAVINVSAAGMITCKSVTSGTCGVTAPPGVTVRGTTVTGYMKQAATSICSWITGIGGWNQIMPTNIMALVSGYAQDNLGFTVMPSHIMGAVAYYGNRVSGTPANGNALTGCTFT